MSNDIIEVRIRRKYTDALIYVFAKVTLIEKGMLDNSVAITNQDGTQHLIRIREDEYVIVKHPKNGEANE